MVTLFKNSLEVIRKAPITSAFDFPWQVLEHYGFNQKCIIFPTYDPSQAAIQQTLARFAFSFFVPLLTLPFAALNATLGGLHLLYCARYIQRIQETPQEREELEKALLRLITVVYDVAWMFLFPRTFKNRQVFRVTFHVIYTLFPDLTRQIHESLFNHQELSTLEEGCLVKQLAKGITDTILGHREKTRLVALPSALMEIHSPKKQQTNP